MDNPATDHGRPTPRIRRSRRGWGQAARLALAVLACTFAGAGQAQPIYQGGLNDAVRELVSALVEGAGPRDEDEKVRLLVESDDFFEIGTDLRLGGCEGVCGLAVVEDRRGVPVVERGGVGVRGARGDGDGAVLG